MNLIDVLCVVVLWIMISSIAGEMLVHYTNDDGTHND